MIGLVYIVIGLAMLFIGGEALVRGAVALAVKLNIPKIVIGLTIVALGTSAPEIVVAVQSAIKGYSDIAVGTVLGSNIANILLVLGFTALICPVTVGPDIRKIDAPFLLFITCACAFFAYFGGFSWREGLIFIALLVGYFISLFFMGRSESVDEDIPDDPDTEPFKMIFALVLGIFLLAVGSEILVRGAVIIAELFGISQGVIAATVVAIGSSSPEIITCVIAAKRNQVEFILGNVIGSNILNILAGLGAATMVTWIHVADSFLRFEIWFMVAVTLLFVWIIKTRPQFNKIHAWFFLALYAGFIIKQVVV